VRRPTALVSLFLILQSTNTLHHPVDSFLLHFANDVHFCHSQNKAGVVTQQWRSKVFELMVQCKSQEIINKEQLSKHQIDVNILKSQLEGKLCCLCQRSLWGELSLQLSIVSD